MGKAEITIGSCWDGRGFYTVEYVNRLFNSCVRNTTIPFDFVLYVGPEAEQPGRMDGMNPAIRVVQTGLPYWWSGFMFWKKDPPGIETDSILYLDLDQVILGSLDDLILYPSDQAYMKGYPKHACPARRERETCVSTSLLRNGAGHKVWDEYERLGRPQWDPWNPPGNRLLPVGCQSIIDDPAQGMKYDLYPEEWICSYRLQVLQRGLPADCRIVAFHGRPKPHEVADDFVKEHWR